MAERSGWTWGEFIGSREWLTVLGSYYTPATLYETAGEAQAALDAHPASKSPHMRLQVAHVTETWHGGVGRAYRVTGAEPDNWEAPARNLRPGDLFRLFGPGYEARRVAMVAHMCNCQDPGGYAVNPYHEPMPAPAGHQAPADRPFALHFPIVRVTAIRGTYVDHASFVAHSPVTFTYDRDAVAA